MGNRFVKGAMILSFGMIFSKVLGLVYVFQFSALVGEAGVSLYTYAYTYYTLFLSLSTLGIPLGIAKFVSRYNAVGEYDTSRKMLRNGALILILLGIFSFAMMFMSAEFLAETSLNGEDALNTIAEVTVAIRLVSFALLIVPIMALLRGFTQGHHDMLPTSVSQIVEQLVRVACIIIGSYVIIYFLDLKQEYAVYFSVFAAFIGALAGLAVLLFFWRKNKKTYDSLLSESVDHPKRDMMDLWKELIIFAVPFAILGLGTSLINFVETVTFNEGLRMFGYSKELSEILYGTYVMKLLKVIQIPITIAIAVGQPLIPELTTLHLHQDMKGVRKNINLALQMIGLVIIPAVVGISVLAQPIYIALYNSDRVGINAHGIEIFQHGAIIGLFLGLYSMVMSILQGINEQYRGIIYLGVGIVIKAVLNVPMIQLFAVDGAIISTVIGLSVTLLLAFIRIKKVTHINFKLTVRRLFVIFAFSGVMAIGVYFLQQGLESIIPVGVNAASRTNAFIQLVICGGVGVLIYGGLALYSDLTSAILGPKFSLKQLKRKFKR